MDFPGSSETEELTDRPSGRRASRGSELTPGARVGRYQILGLIGRGGMGEVYAAYHPDLDRRIALKVVYGERAANAQRQERLLREARIIARLNHPNIVAVHDAGMVGDRVYVAMEFVEGQTISAWLRERRRSWQAIVEVFLASGRGLAAAHAANVIHCDFKPQNVMIGQDGRVRVMDFGVARPLPGGMDLATSSAAGGAETTASTTAGALLGTRAYMAPEQLDGAPADTRSDQFSFCVALREALCGARPGGQVPEPAAGPARRGPPWLRGVVRRGLEADRRKRFASMQDLLRALERGRTRIRRRGIALAAAASLLLAAVLGSRVSTSQRFACTPPRDRIDAIWPAGEGDGSRRTTIHGLFRASKLPDAEAVWSKVAGILDEHVRDWSAMYTEACQATHERGEQSPEVLDLRMTCLRDNLDEVRAYADTLLDSDASTLGRAVFTANSLSPVRACTNVKNLRLELRLPEDPVTRAAVQSLQERIKDTDMLLSLGHPEQAVAKLQQIVPAARALDYKPLLARTLKSLGWAQGQVEKFDDAKRTLDEALITAEAAHDDLTAATVADFLAYALMIGGQYPEAERWFSFAEAVVDRLQKRDTLLDAWISNDRGAFYYLKGQFRKAEAAERASIAIKTKLLGPEHQDVGTSMSNLALILVEMDRLDEAYDLARRAIDILERNDAQDSIVYANEATNLALILVKQRRLDEADVVLTKALRVAQKASREPNTVLAEILAVYGDLLLARDDTAAATRVLSRARAIQIDIKETNPVVLAGVSGALGRAMADSGIDVSRAKRFAYEACTTYLQAGFSNRRRDLLAAFSVPQDVARTSGCSGLRPGERQLARPPVRKLQKDHVGRRPVPERVR